MTDFNEWNKAIIAEFRANAGKLGGNFAGATAVIINHTGAKSGKTYTNPLVCTIDDGDVVIIASKGGAPTHPDWYYNLKANPTVTVELGTETFQAQAIEVSGDERDRLFAAQAAVMPQFNNYVVAAGERKIPVFRLKRS